MVGKISKNILCRQEIHEITELELLSEKLNNDEIWLVWYNKTIVCIKPSVLEVHKNEN